MAITTLDGVLAGMQAPQEIVKAITPTLVAGRPHSLAYLAGRPGAMAAPAGGMAGLALTTKAGQIPFTNPVSGNAYLARFSGQSSSVGRLLLCDRLWEQSGISVTTTTAQTIDSATWPARDMNGATAGEGVMIGLEVSAATGAGASTISISYTDSGNGGPNTGAALDAYVASSAIGAFYRFGLAAGDTGVKQVLTYTSTVSMTSGTVHLVAYRLLASVSVTQGHIAAALDALTGGLPRLYDNTVPFLLFIPQATTASNVGGEVIYTHG